MLAADRHAMQPRIDDGHGLDEDLFRRPSEIAIAAAPNSVLLNGRIMLPSPVVPSANSTIASPLASRLAISLACVARRTLALALDEYGALQLRRACR